VVPENIHTHTTGGISEFRREEGVTSTGIPRTWGVHWTGNPKAWGDFQESNFQFGVEKLVKNDLSKDDDSLVNTRHVQLNQHAGDTFQWSWSIIKSVYGNMTAESCSLASRSVTKTIVGFPSIVLLEYNTVDPSKGFSAPILKQISPSHM